MTRPECWQALWATTCMLIFPMVPAMNVTITISILNVGSHDCRYPPCDFGMCVFFRHNISECKTFKPANNTLCTHGAPCQNITYNGTPTVPVLLQLDVTTEMAVNVRIYSTNLRNKCVTGEVPVSPKCVDTTQPYLYNHTTISFYVNMSTDLTSTLSPSSSTYTTSVPTTEGTTATLASSAVMSLSSNVQSASVTHQPTTATTTIQIATATPSSHATKPNTTHLDSKNHTSGHDVENHPGSEMGQIIGIAVGSAALLAGIVVLIICCCKKKINRDEAGETTTGGSSRSSATRKTATVSHTSAQHNPGPANNSEEAGNTMQNGLMDSTTGHVNISPQVRETTASAFKISTSVQSIPDHPHQTRLPPLDRAQEPADDAQSDRRRRREERKRSNRPIPDHPHQTRLPPLDRSQEPADDAQSDRKRRREERKRSKRERKRASPEENPNNDQDGLPRGGGSNRGSPEETSNITSIFLANAPNNGTNENQLRDEQSNGKRSNAVTSYSSLDRDDQIRAGDSNHESLNNANQSGGTDVFIVIAPPDVNVDQSNNDSVNNDVSNVVDGASVLGLGLGLGASVLGLGLGLGASVPFIETWAQTGEYSSITTEKKQKRTYEHEGIGESVIVADISD